MGKKLSFADYARHRGVTKAAVTFAVQAGRIPVETDPKTGKRSINPEKADPLWERNTLHDHRRNTNTTRSDREAKPAPEGSKGNVPSINDSRAIKEAYLARLAKLEYEQKASSLVSAEEVRVGWGSIVTTTKTKLLAVPSKAKAILPHLTLGDIAAIEELIREALQELSE